jgi:assimilatory nitrate reductase catalytic subunit
LFWTEKPTRGAGAANLLTNDALDPRAVIPEFKACAVQVFPAREDELPNPDAVVQRGRY